MADKLPLQGLKPMVRGDLHDVFQHPDNNGWLIKVPRPDRSRNRWSYKRGLPVQRRYGIYTGWLREIAEYLAVRSRESEYPRSLSRVTGLAETDLGLGLVVEKICDREGRLAPTLQQVVAAGGLTDALRQRIAALEDEMIARNVVLGDVHQRNILCGWDADGGDRLVIIEGLGAKTIIPVNSMSPYLNRRSIRRRFARIMQVLEQIDNERRDGESHRIL
jgi:hypothetical protein